MEKVPEAGTVTTTVPAFTTVLVATEPDKIVKLIAGEDKATVVSTLYVRSAAETKLNPENKTKARTNKLIFNLFIILFFCFF